MGTSVTRFFAAVLISSSLAPLARAQLGVTGPAGGNQPHSTVQPSLGINYIIRTAGTFDRLGEVSIFGGNFAPLGFKIANGQSLPISEYEPLFNLIGTTYGGDGETTFNLPDLRGRAVVGTGTGPASGTTYNYGFTHGSEEVTLGVNHLPSHTHSIAASQTEAAGGGQAYNNMQPVLAMGHRLVTAGPFPSRNTFHSGPEPLLGQVIVSAASSNFIPNYQTETNGQILPINQNQALFSILGVMYGGNGQTNFALPDQRGRVLTHAGESAGPSLTLQTLGQRTGQETVTLSQAQMPAHDHSLPPSPFFTGSTGGGQPQNNMQPTLAVNYMIALQGIFPPRDEPGAIGWTDEPFVGQIAIFSSNFAPAGWALADGAILPISQNTALFSILGTTYGGDGRTTFALPDLRGLLPVGAGQGVGLSNWELGERRGDETVVLLESQIPAHTHAYVPEPGGLSALVLCAAFLVRRRNR